MLETRPVGSLRALALVWVGAVLFAMLAACGELEPEGSGPAPLPGRGVYVIATWQENREVVGHRVHVVEKQVPCAKCHDLSGRQMDLPKARVCTGECHAEQAKMRHGLGHGDAAKEGPANCLACHAFAPPRDEDLVAGKAPEKWDCMRCHTEQRGATPAVVIHAKSTCDSCHRPHSEPSVQRTDCHECHDDHVTTHASRGKQPAQVCATCHQQQHARADRARHTCKACHSKSGAPAGVAAPFPAPIVPATALFEGGHIECTGCHRPHDYAKEQALACTSCHTDRPVIGGGRIPQHAKCTSCHQPHSVRTGMAGACLGCHKGRATDHPQAAGIGVCASCHEAHPERGQKAAARACSSCHHAAANDKAFHGARCSGCHQPHRFKLAATDRKLCSRCHAAQVSGTAKRKGHGTCGECHSGLPHQPSRTTKSCAGCHAPIASKALVNHSLCRQCHEPHGGAVVKACGGCHAAVQARAPAGHRQCTGCHEPHSAKVLLAKTCASCHADQARSVHARAGCASCHSPHGARGATFAPGCTTCHATTSLKALHVVPKHRLCAKCHGAHKTRMANERPVCLGCHADKRDHQPDASRCSGCHLFR